MSRYSRYGVAYYWQGGHVEFDNEVFFKPFVVGDGVFILEWHDIDGALEDAIEAATQPGATGRVWVIRSHLTGTGGRDSEWSAAYAAAGLVVETIPVGIEPLQVFTVDR